MDIVIENVCKFFPKKKAVDNLSCNIRQGYITGLLGQNGAGKSTLMQMIVGKIKPTKGNIIIGKYSQRTHTKLLSKKIGYLSEENPLYEGMYVREFLNFMGKIYGLQKKERQRRIDWLIDHCSLEEIICQTITTLSKGQRQRVGIAKALIHDPSVLVLDEPTTGLDSQQLQKIRTLFKNIAPQKTIIFSTHIMEEVRMLCQRVIFLQQGKIQKAAQENFLKDHTTVLYVRFAEGNVSALQLSKIPGVQRVAREENDWIFFSHHPHMASAIFHWACAQKLTLTMMYEKNVPVSMQRIKP